MGASYKLNDRAPGVDGKNDRKKDPFEGEALVYITFASGPVLTPI